MVLKISKCDDCQQEIAEIALNKKLCRICYEKAKKKDDAKFWAFMASGVPRVKKDVKQSP